MKFCPYQIRRFDFILTVIIKSERTIFRYTNFGHFVQYKIKKLFGWSCNKVKLLRTQNTLRSKSYDQFNNIVQIYKKKMLSLCYRCGHHAIKRNDNNRVATPKSSCFFCISVQNFNTAIEPIHKLLILFCSYTLTLNADCFTSLIATRILIQSLGLHYHFNVSYLDS